MAGHRPWREVRRGDDASPESAAFRDAVSDALALGEIRGRRGLTQVDVARLLQTSQASVSKLERREDLYLSTLRDYVEALGGTLELAAVFPEGRIAIATPGAEGPKQDPHDPIAWTANSMGAIVDLEDKAAIRRKLDAS